MLEKLMIKRDRLEKQISIASQPGMLGMILQTTEKLIDIQNKDHPEESQEQIVTLWCDNCYTWVDEVSVDVLADGEKWISCQACGNGLVHYEKVPS